MRLKPVETDATASARSEIRRLHRAPEPEVLKPLLRDADPLGSEALRAYHGTFPSGHATVAMSLALAAALAAPAALRTAAALVGGAWAAGIGVSLLVTQAHYGSDIAAGYLISGA